jgi:hypothetical protein
MRPVRPSRFLQRVPKNTVLQAMKNPNDAARPESTNRKTVDKNIAVMNRSG